MSWLQQNDPVGVPVGGEAAEVAITDPGGWTGGRIGRETAFAFCRFDRKQIIPPSKTKFSKIENAKNFFMQSQTRLSR